MCIIELHFISLWTLHLPSLTVGRILIITVVNVSFNTWQVFNQCLANKINKCHLTIQCAYLGSVIIFRKLKIITCFWTLALFIEKKPHWLLFIQCSSNARHHDLSFTYIVLFNLHNNLERYVLFYRWWGAAKSSNLTEVPYLINGRFTA